MDYFDIIRGGAGEGFADAIFKVQDCDGRLLSMRGEVTTQIARMLASRGRREGRVFYIENCIRFLEEKTVSRREFWQAGAELVGGSEVETDAEIIALTLTSLERMGIRGGSIDIGNIGFFKAIAQVFDISDVDSLRRALASRSTGDLGKTPEAREALSFLVSRRGGPELVRELTEMIYPRDAGGKGIALGEYTTYFEKLFQLLDAYGCAGKVKVDLTTLREMGYYNGTVFDILIDGIGVPVGGGGRYDAMMREFGIDTKATGFALSVDLCVRALNAEGFKQESAPVKKVLYRDGYVDKAIRLAGELREKGTRCMVDRFNGEEEGIVVGDEIQDLVKRSRAGEER